MPKAIRWFIKFLCVIITLVIFLFALAVGGFVYFNAPPEGKAEPLENAISLNDDDDGSLNGSLILEVKSGETASAVGVRLENAGVIKSRYFWNLLFKLDKEQIKTGTYRIELPASQMEIRSILINGDQLLVKVTVPEGVTLKKIARILEDAQIANAEAFLKAAASREILDTYNIPGASMEGYLYPDTYFFPLNYPAAKIVATMADTFFKRLEEIAPEAFGPQAISAEELNTRVIIASIVEREYRIAEEAPLMAGVFFNRQKIGMALQSCATVVYVITEVLERPHPEVLYSRDLEIKNPYNTYLRAGLPPGPISAPGKTALRAAFTPASSNYLYFRLVDAGAGEHYFSMTLDDHIRAGTFFIKGR